jgi:hypothetical protein
VQPQGFVDGVTRRVALGEVVGVDRDASRAVGKREVVGRDGVAGFVVGRASACAVRRHGYRPPIIVHEAVPMPVGSLRDTQPASLSS